MIKGIVPDFGYDVKLAITVDQEKKDNIPESDATKENNYYRVGVSCSNEVKGEWDYNAWNLKLNNVVEGTKCNLTFTSNMSKEEHDNIIKEGVAYRRNTYRGKDITNYYKGETINGRNLYDQIGNCTFDDIYVGDYIKTNTNDKEVTWLIADLNNYLHTGITELKTCHATIIPATTLESAPMNEKNTTGVVDSSLTLTTSDKQQKTSIGAYVGSKMKQTTLPEILKNYITPVFDNHIITYSNLLADQIDPNRYNQYGSDNIKGASSTATFYDSQVDLMGEMNVYGGIVASSSVYDIGIDNRQYAIFQLKPEFINSYGGQCFNYWLKAVANSTGFAYVGTYGYADGTIASGLIGVRPRFLID